MRDYAIYFYDIKFPEKRGVNIRRDIDWWMEYFIQNTAKLLFLALLAVLFLTFKLFWQLSKSDDAFPIKRINLVGNILITKPKDIQKSLAELSNTSFFSININKAATEIEKLPWVDKATITRNWPNTLSIYLVERQAAYRWGHGELIDIDGNRFANVDNKVFANLPQLSGIDGHEREVILAYQQLIEKLGSGIDSLGVKSFILNKYLSWELHLQSGMIVKFGQDNFQQRLNRFVYAYQSGKLPDLAKLDIIDLRYQRGLSVKWKPEFTPSARKNMILKVSRKVI